MHWVSSLIALEQAVSKVNARKVITFHSRISRAAAFARNDPRGIPHYLKGYSVSHVHGKQNSTVRSEAIETFASTSHAILTNARCLTEGIDIPVIDMVAFIDPRESTVDIVQAIGRAMRKPRGPTTKERGYVLVPLFASLDGSSLEETIENEKFDAIAKVLNALQEHDEELTEIIRELRRDKGRGRRRKTQKLGDKIEIIGPEVMLDDLLESIAAQIIDRLGVPWDESFGRLLNYKEKYGDCLVKQKYKDLDDYSLGSWVTNQRALYNKGKLKPEYKRQLDEIGFIWNIEEASWQEAYALLKAFKEREGHCRPSRRLKVESKFHDGSLSLGTWGGTQRGLWKKGELQEERYQKLLDLGFRFDSHGELWDFCYSEVLKFFQKFGHCNLPSGYTVDGINLQTWFKTQRTKKNHGKLSEDRIMRLDEIGFDWDPMSKKWEKGFCMLVAFREKFNHVDVKPRFIFNNYPLGNWVGIQRSWYKKINYHQIELKNSIILILYGIKRKVLGYRFPTYL